MRQNDPEVTAYEDDTVGRLALPRLDRTGWLQGQVEGQLPWKLSPRFDPSA